MSHDPAGIERTVLSHDAWPGYDRAFTVVFIAALIYLGVVYAVVGADYVDHHATTGTAGHGASHTPTVPPGTSPGTTPPPGSGPNTGH